MGDVPAFFVSTSQIFLYASCPLYGVHFRQRGEPEGLHIYRDGENQYSYTSRKDRRKRTVMAVASLEDAPAGFVSEQAHAVKGMYLYCPEDAGIPLPPPQKEADKVPKRKEAER